MEDPRSERDIISREHISETRREDETIPNTQSAPHQLT